MGSALIWRVSLRFKGRGDPGGEGEGRGGAKCKIAELRTSELQRDQRAGRS